MIGRSAQDDELRYIMSAPSGRKRDRKGRIGARESRSYDVQLKQGQVVFEYAKMNMGEEAMSHIVERGQKPRLPKYFWPNCCEKCFNRVCTDALRKSLKKAFHYYIERLRTGATTTTGMLGDKKAGQKRSTGGSLNSVKCAELGQLLNYWFIDCIQVYSARVNFGLFMTSARYLKGRLLATGYEPQNSYRWRIFGVLRSPMRVDTSAHSETLPCAVYARRRYYRL